MSAFFIRRYQPGSSGARFRPPIGGRSPRRRAVGAIPKSPPNCCRACMRAAKLRHRLPPWRKAQAWGKKASRSWSPPRLAHHARPMGTSRRLASSLVGSICVGRILPPAVRSARMSKHFGTNGRGVEQDSVEQDNAASVPRRQRIHRGVRACRRPFRSRLVDFSGDRSWRNCRGYKRIELLRRCWSNRLNATLPIWPRAMKT